MNRETKNFTDHISLRPVILPDDENFLIEVYCGTRNDLNVLPVSETQKNAILQMQYNAQKQHYDQAYPDAEHSIVLFDNKPFGRLIISRENNVTRLVDISLLPGCRNSGIGTVLLESILTEASENNCPVELHVLKASPAVRLYLRLGFVVTEDNGVYFRMERRQRREY